MKRTGSIGSLVPPAVTSTPQPARSRQALAGPPAAVGTGSGSVWAADASNGTVSRIDPHSGVVVDRIVVGGDPASITSGDGAIWVANTVGATILRIDPATETVTPASASPSDTMKNQVFPRLLRVGDVMPLVVLARRTILQRD